MGRGLGRMTPMPSQVGAAKQQRAGEYAKIVVDKRTRKVRFVAARCQGVLKPSKAQGREV